MQQLSDGHEVQYLDTVGDGLPDAVEHVYRRRRRMPGADREFVEETHRIAYGIGIDGKPAGTRERTVLIPAAPKQPGTQSAR